MMFRSQMGKRVLVIEDDYPQANDLTLAGLQGNDVVGPFPGLKVASRLLPATTSKPQFWTFR